VSEKKKLWRWNKGRQDAKYDVFPFLMSEWLKMDCYVIRIHTGAKIPEHTDKVKEGWLHYRFNIHFGSYLGGILKCEKFIWRWRDVYLFRPDVTKHSMSEVIFGRVYIFSFGFLRRDAKYLPHGPVHA
jgi:hypothetical protein